MPDVDRDGRQQAPPVEHEVDHALIVPLATDAEALMSIRLDEHAYAPGVVLAAFGVALIRLGFALRPTIKEN